eukprot:3333771-Ditylum_brightwellii.AAC.1
MQTRHLLVVATTPHDRKGLTGPTRLLCLLFAQLSTKYTPSKTDQNKTSASSWANVCVSGKLPNHHCT